MRDRVAAVPVRVLKVGGNEAACPGHQLLPVVGCAAGRPRLADSSEAAETSRGLRVRSDPIDRTADGFLPATAGVAGQTV